MKSDKKKGDEEVADQNTKSDILLYENIFRQYYEALIRYAFRFVNDAMVAENIIHDVFLYLWNERKRINFTINIKTYLYNAVKNRCLNYLKRQKLENDYRVLDFKIENNTQTPESILINKELNKVIKSVLNKMPPTEYGVNAYLTTAIRDNSSASKNRPEEFYVFRNYPNPFNPSTKLEFTIPKRMHVKITIYDLLGKVVTKITDDYYNIGTYNYIWTAKDNKGNLLANGLYIARMDCGEYSKNIKLILLK